MEERRCEEELAFAPQMESSTTISLFFFHGNKSDHAWKVIGSREKDRDTERDPSDSHFTESICRDLGDICHCSQDQN